MYNFPLIKYVLREIYFGTEQTEGEKRDSEIRNIIFGYDRPRESDGCKKY